MGIDPELFRRLREKIGDDAKLDEPMSRHTSFRAGGPASLFVRARTSAMLEHLVPLIAQSSVPWRVLGGGNNILVADAGVRECIIGVDSDKAEPEVLEERTAPDGTVEVVVRFPAGCKLILAAKRAVDLGLGGLEWAVGVPGTLGGSAVNNAGAHGADMAGILVGATAVEAGAIVKLRLEDMEYSYRYSVFKGGKRRGAAIMSVDLRLRRAPRDELAQMASRFETTRKQRQPPGLSAGSVFKNPPGDYSGRLIEAAGLKGTATGAAQVSMLHGNFFLNTGGATAGDIYRLMRTAQDRVWERFGVWLEPELELVGEWTEEEREALRRPSVAFAQPPADSHREPVGRETWAHDKENPDYEASPGEEADS